MKLCVCVLLSTGNQMRMEKCIHFGENTIVVDRYRWVDAIILICGKTVVQRQKSILIFIFSKWIKDYGEN